MAAELKAEWWVMRVIVHPNRARKYMRPGVPELLDIAIDRAFSRPEDITLAIAGVRSGQYIYLDGLGILEPVDEAQDSNGKATERAIAYQTRYPGETFVTVLNADPDELAKDPTADGAMS